MWLVACGGDDGVCVPPAGQGFDWQPACKTVDCAGVTSCDVACAIGMSCGTLDCAGAGQCRYDCQQGATCPLTDCRNTGSCGVHCWDHSTCDVKCDRSMGCGVACTGGAECVLECGTNAGTVCKFDACTGGTGPIDCGNGLLVCNRACP